jgi:hypothetical protein
VCVCVIFDMGHVDQKERERERKRERERDSVPVITVCVSGTIIVL